MVSPLLKLLVLRTHRLEELKKFYETLGIKFVKEQHGSGPDHYVGPIGSAVLELYPLSAGAPGPDKSVRLGFAVPSLRLRYTALTSALIVGLLHGTWHFLIAFWAGGSFSGGQWTTYLLGILFFYLGTLPAYRVLMVWVYDRTGSLLVAVLMHASYIFSTLFVLAPPTTGGPFLTYSGVFAVALWVVVAAVAMANGGRLSRQPLRRAA